jgi:hypothetical protein
LNLGPIDYEDPDDPASIGQRRRLAKLFLDADFRFEAVRTYSELLWPFGSLRAA